MKVLIISHNPMTTYNNMGKTIAAHFSQFAPEELCQLYIYPSVPDVASCPNCYRITDKDVMKSYFTFRVKGQRIQPDVTANRSYEDPADEKRYQKSSNHSPRMELLRDLMWKCARWYQKDLRQWLQAQKPDCVFVCPGKSKFLYDMALKIAEKYRLPMVSYICDDYYFVAPGKTWGERLVQKLLRKKIEKLMAKTSHLISICPEMTKAYGERFGVDASTVMTGTAIPVAQKAKEAGQASALTYLGNLSCGRNASLAQIGQALEEINRELGTQYRLNIYSGETSPALLACLGDIPAIRLKGFVSGKSYEEAFFGADILVHTEGFAPEDIDRVKYSVSTKIADSLASGICLFAYGPESVASVAYLQENQCALVAGAPEVLKSALLQALESPALRAQAAEKGLQAAKANHNAAANSQRIHAILAQIAG